MNETKTEPAGPVINKAIPAASVHKSKDSSWVRWAVVCQWDNRLDHRLKAPHQTEWFKVEAKAVAKANKLCREAGTITWTEYEAARALKRQRVEALPDLIAAAKAFLAAYRQSPAEPTLDICRAADLTAAALEKAGAK